jgi:hypothetical protein
MATLHKLRLIPADGITIKTTTTNEWMFGQFFKVLSSSYLPISVGSEITIRDIETAEEYYPIKFDITFNTQSLYQKVKGDAKDDYLSQMILDTMFDDKTLILRRGQ